MITADANLMTVCVDPLTSAAAVSEQLVLVSLAAKDLKQPSALSECSGLQQLDWLFRPGHTLLSEQ